MESPPPKPGADRAWVDRLRARDQYALVLISIVLALLAMAINGDSPGGQLIADALLAAALVYAMRTSGAPSRAVRLAILLCLVATAASVIGELVAARTFGTALTAVVAGALVVITAVVIGRRLASEPEVTLQRVLGALCIYLLLGILFAFLFEIVGWLTGEPFFTQRGRSNVVDFLYFSYTSLTTVGYGDFTARSDVGRILAITEALMGQFYLVTVVAILVSRLRRP